ncbi:hypothetical protein GUITHDRAFT_164081 [Guillardia theta CCMP2712]|uniref:Uncharacterized protein n=1 Tax=Guillardia theta (strain CCMP2712) TaxID=905079 RepID=L1J2F6_GUITC|nr:hypothetical protein GUITHDRAFT_164081 [Guillardia theta CCMP2712]EKX42711.1 hypothetical protein GUITHDRAFT_164081 [Guillardia theta CCMP2712]|eukprot:XP_005829691.1 hypothetical protein GUITHDRAFT_164081 [Guillardia theta CCMP2712]
MFLPLLVVGDQALTHGDISIILRRVFHETGRLKFLLEDLGVRSCSRGGETLYQIVALIDQNSRIKLAKIREKLAHEIFASEAIKELTCTESNEIALSGFFSASSHEAQHVLDWIQHGDRSASRGQARTELLQHFSHNLGENEHEEEEEEEEHEEEEEVYEARSDGGFVRLRSPEVVNPVSPGGGRGDPRALVPSVETVMHVQQVVVSDVDLLQQRDGKGRKLLVDLKELDALHGWERQLMKTLMDKKVDEQQQSSLYEYVG